MLTWRGYRIPLCIRRVIWLFRFWRTWATLLCQFLRLLLVAFYIILHFRAIFNPMKIIQFLLHLLLLKFLFFLLFFLTLNIDFWFKTVDFKLARVTAYLNNGLVFVEKNWTSANCMVIFFTGYFVLFKQIYELFMPILNITTLQNKLIKANFLDPILSFFLSNTPIHKGKIFIIYC